MTTNPDTPPDVTRSDVGTVLVTRYDVSSPESQRVAAEASIVEWESTMLPDGCLSLTCFASTDGDSVLHYSQWTDDEAVREYARAEYPKRVRGLIDGVPELDDGDTTEYQLYRSDVSDASGAPACFVVVTVEFDGPDPERAREWVDRMFDADAPEEDPIPGLFSAHFHVGADGTRALNYAEWTSEAAHREMMEGAAKAAEDEHLREAEETESDRATDSPTIDGFDVQRYRLHRSLTGR